MPFSNSRLVPLAFWVGFIGLGLATNINHDKKPLGFARDRQEMNVASAAGKRLPLLLIRDFNQPVMRD